MSMCWSSLARKDQLKTTVDGISGVRCNCRSVSMA
jgi:hypothetical protein